jgi:hypothetical protein
MRENFALKFMEASVKAPVWVLFCTISFWCILIFGLLLFSAFTYRSASVLGLNVSVSPPAPQEYRIIQGNASVGDSTTWAKCQWPGVTDSRSTYCGSDVHFKFVPPFNATPSVITGLCNIDAESGKNVRITAYASDIDANGFVLRVAKWGDTVINYASYSWTAIGR